MPHQRDRHATDHIRRTLKFSPIVGILGHRQVGKTTLSTLLGSEYVTLDERNALESSLADPSGFLANRSGTPLVIDECQLSPPLFPALKEWVRTHPKPGQFLLTGSVRFSSRKAIRESLTGRIITWDLLPMDLSETHHAPLPDTLPRLLRASSVEIDLPRKKYATPGALETYLSTGGLPGVFAVRGEALRAQRFETQIETILERDLRLLVETSLDYRVLRTLLRELASLQGLPLEWAPLSRRTRISIPTLKNLVRAYESLFLIRTLETRGTEKKPIIFFEDQGEASYLTEGARSPLTDLTRLLYANIRHQAVYRPELKIRLFQYRNRGGAMIPLCAQSPLGTVGFIPSLHETPEHTALPSTRSFLKAFPNAKIVFFHLGTAARVLDRRVCSLPLARLV